MELEGDGCSSFEASGKALDPFALGGSCPMLVDRETYHHSFHPPITDQIQEFGLSRALGALKGTYGYGKLQGGIADRHPDPSLPHVDRQHTLCHEQSL